MTKSQVSVFTENKYSEFTTFFRIQFQDNRVESLHNEHLWKDLLGSWSNVCILALEMRMDSCMSMLFRNRNNVIVADEYHVTYRKSNGQLHTFNIQSFQEMERMITLFKEGRWEIIKENELGVRQLLKALYWIPEDCKKDQGGFGFGQLISCLEEFTLSRAKSGY